jgi:hypothetical protein
MESSCAGAPPARKLENIKAAGKARERETNASDLLVAPLATGRQETNAPCLKETAKSMGARETNVPEERSAAVRRVGEPLTSAAKKRRQKEAAADRHQAAAGERSPPSVGVDTRFVPLSATGPKCKLRYTVSADRQQLTAAKSRTGIRGSKLRLEARCELARYLKAGADYLYPLAVRRIIQVGDEDIMGSLAAIC